MKTTILLVTSFMFQYGFAQTTANLEVGKKLGERPGYGVGEHYVNNLEFNEDKQPKLLTKLVKAADTYELTLSSERIFNITSSPTSPNKISIKFKCRHVAEKYLVDIVSMPNDEIMIALTEPPHGYEFIKFKRINNNYAPYLHAEINFVSGLDVTKPNKAKKMGFEVDGSFFVILSDESIDRYSIPEKGDYVFRNKKEYDVSQINRYDEGLPNHLKIE